MGAQACFQGRDDVVCQPLAGLLSCTFLAMFVFVFFQVFLLRASVPPIATASLHRLVRPLRDNRQGKTFSAHQKHLRVKAFLLFLVSHLQVVVWIGFRRVHEGVHEATSTKQDKSLSLERAGCGR